MVARRPGAGPPLEAAMTRTLLAGWGLLVAYCLLGEVATAQAATWLVAALGVLALIWAGLARA